VALKLEVAKAAPYDKAHTLETAFVVEEMIRAVEKGKYELSPREKRSIKKPANKAVLLKKEQKEQLAVEEKKRMQKFEARKAELAKQLENQAEKNKQKRQEIEDEAKRK
jgi:hypothetical protein